MRLLFIILPTLLHLVTSYINHIPLYISKNKKSTNDNPVSFVYPGIDAFEYGQNGELLVEFKNMAVLGKNEVTGMDDTLIMDIWNKHEYRVNISLRL